MFTGSLQNTPIQQVLYCCDGKTECLKSAPIQANTIPLSAYQMMTPQFPLGELASLIFQIDPQQFLQVVRQGQSFEFVKSALTQSGMLRYPDSGCNLDIEPEQNWQHIIDELIKLYPIFQFHQTSPYSVLVYEALGLAKLQERYRDFWTVCEQYPEQNRMRFFLFLMESGFFRDMPSDLAQQQLYHRDVLNHVDTATTQEMMSFFAEFTSAYAHTHEYAVLLFEQVLTATTYHVLSENKSMKICPNCGRSFVPTGRSDTMYCTNPSPQQPSLTCRQFKSQKSYFEKLKLDDLAALSRNIYSAKQMMLKRHPNDPAYQAIFEYFKNERKVWTKALEDGTRTREQYAEWLNDMKNRRTLD